MGRGCLEHLHHSDLAGEVHDGAVETQCLLGHFPCEQKISDNMMRGEMRRSIAPEPAAMRDAMPSSRGDGDDVCAADRGATDTVSETALMNSEDDV